MARCDHCGNETTLPFTCQHCGRKYCADCRLPPNHTCSGIGSWNKKPRPAIGMSYGKGGGISATGGGPAESLGMARTQETQNTPYLWIMAAIIGLILLGLAWLTLGGYRLG